MWVYNHYHELEWLTHNQILDEQTNQTEHDLDQKPMTHFEWW